MCYLVAHQHLISAWTIMPLPLQSPQQFWVVDDQIYWDVEQWMMEHVTVPGCDAYPDDADFLTMDQIDLLDRHE
jgi:hypothetical protein